jgi:hypothetical protein
VAGPLALVFLRHAFLDQLVEVSLDRLLVVVSGATDDGEGSLLSGHPRRPSSGSREGYSGAIPPTVTGERLTGSVR